MGYSIRLQKMSAPRRQHLADRGFSTRDTASETYAEHRASNFAGWNKV
jgi:hypothetical protein